ncbi:glycosyltransferase family A protein [Acidobacteriota bacterium]
MSLVSVIIPVYNRSEFICEAIESVLAQTYTNYEIVVVDDGSTVDIKQILQPFWQKIKYLYQENKGLAAARNTGILNSNGKYLAFLDDDDLFESEKLEIQVKELEDNPNLGFVFSDYFSFEAKNPARKKLISTKLRNVKRDELANYYFIDQDLAVSSFLVRRKSINKVGLFDESLEVTEDVDLWLRMFLYDQGEYSSYPSTRIRGGVNRMSQNRILINETSIKNLKRVLDKNPNFAQKLGAIADKKIVKLHYWFGRALFENNEVSQARKEFVFCAKSYPFMIKKVYLYLFFCVIGRSSTNVILKFWRFLWNHFFKKYRRSLLPRN